VPQFPSPVCKLSTRNLPTPDEFPSWLFSFFYSYFKDRGCVINAITFWVNKGADRCILVSNSGTFMSILTCSKHVDIFSKNIADIPVSLAVAESTIKTTVHCSSKPAISRMECGIDRQNCIRHCSIFHRDITFHARGNIAGITNVDHLENASDWRPFRKL
jgi:hypothetical protein